MQLLSYGYNSNHIINLISLIKKPITNKIIPAAINTIAANINNNFNILNFLLIFYFYTNNVYYTPIFVASHIIC